MKLGVNKGTKQRHLTRLCTNITKTETCASNSNGVLEKRAGDMGRALKHFIIALGFGYIYTGSIFTNGDATKEDYAKALRVYQACLQNSSCFSDKYYLLDKIVNSKIDV